MTKLWYCDKTRKSDIVTKQECSYAISTTVLPLLVFSTSVFPLDLVFFRPVVSISQQGGPKNTRGANFCIKHWMCAASGGTNIKWGARVLNGVAGHHCPPLATALVSLHII